MGYQDLVFDLYGTLVDIRTEENDPVWEKTAIYYGFYGAHYTREELKAAFQQAMEQRKAQAGQSYECFPDIPIEQVMEELFQKKGIQSAAQLGLHAAQLFRVASMEYICRYPGVGEALTQLRKQGFRLWLLSNAQRAFTAYELRHLELESIFDGIYISSDYGCRKPDARFYRALLQERGLKPEQCLMIGNDRDTDIAGAAAVGMATLYMHTNITPPGQKEANPALHPAVASKNCMHWEYEGSDWEELVKQILRIAM